MEQNDFAKECVAPPKGIKKTAFFEAINTRDLEQLTEIFTHLVKQAGRVLPDEYAHLGNLVSKDGYLIDAVLSMEWADCRKQHQEPVSVRELRNQIANEAEEDQKLQT